MHKKDHYNTIKLCDICLVAIANHTIKIMQPGITKTMYFCEKDYFTIQFPETMLLSAEEELTLYEEAPKQVSN